MKTSTELKRVSLRAPDGLVHVVEYDAVGPARVMEHLVLVEVGRIFKGSGEVAQPVSAAVKDMLVNPRTV
jgi:hypothetical protein